jgi:hypothetical protein
MSVRVDFRDNEFHTFEKADGIIIDPENNGVIRVTSGMTLVAFVPVDQIDVIQIESDDADGDDA